MRIVGRARWPSRRASGWPVLLAGKAGQLDGVVRAEQAHRSRVLAREVAKPGHARLLRLPVEACRACGEPHGQRNARRAFQLAAGIVRIATVNEPAIAIAYRHRTVPAGVAGQRD